MACFQKVHAPENDDSQEFIFVKIVKTSAHKRRVKTVHKTETQGLQAGEAKCPGQKTQGNHSAYDNKGLEHQQGLRTGD